MSRTLSLAVLAVLILGTAADYREDVELDGVPDMKWMTTRTLAQKQFDFDMLFLASTIAPNLFGAVIVNESNGQILCTGATPVGGRWWQHAEMTAMQNCTTMYEPSPTAPRLNWNSFAILYTNAESCPMCTGGSAYFRPKQVIYGVSMDYLKKRLCTTQFGESTSAKIIDDSHRDGKTGVAAGVLGPVDNHFFGDRYFPNRCPTFPNPACPTSVPNCRVTSTTTTS